MDPFFAASTPAPRSKRRPRREYAFVSSESVLDPPDLGSGPPGEAAAASAAPLGLAGGALASPGAAKSPGTLRRSTGRFNLKINAPRPEPGGAPAGGEPSARSAAKPPLPRVKTGGLSLKRPHPFSTGKQPTKQWGFLARSSTAALASPQGSKRLHVTDAAGELPPGPDLSFQGAKPVQTAFASVGLQSKKHAPQTPVPRVPETPVKRAVPAGDPLSGPQYSKHPGHAPLDHGSPFPGSRAPHSLAQLEASDMSSTDSLGSRLKLSVGSRMHTPIDRLKRFSIGQIDESDIPDTPTRHSDDSGLLHPPLHHPRASLSRDSIQHPFQHLTPRDPLPRDSLYRDSIQRDPVPRDPLRDSGHPDPSQHGSVHQASPHASAPHASAPHDSSESVNHLSILHPAQPNPTQPPVPPQHYQYRSHTTPSLPRPSRPPLPALPVSEDLTSDEMADDDTNDEGDDELLHRFADSGDAELAGGVLYPGAGRQGSEAITVTPGTAVRPRPHALDSHVLRSADPTDSMSMSPLWSRDTLSFSDTTGPHTPGKLGHDSVASPSFAESQSSPRPRRRLRLFGIKADKSPAPARSSGPVYAVGQPKSVPSSASTAISAGSAANASMSASSHTSSGSSVLAISPSAGAKARAAKPAPAESYIAPVPPLRLETPLGRPQLDSPKTPATTASFYDSPPLFESDHAGRPPSVVADLAETSADSHSSTEDLVLPCPVRARNQSHSSSDSSLRVPSSRSLAHRLKDESALLYDAHLVSKFEKVQSAANGEFSCVFVVVQGKQRFAVKRTKKPLVGQRDRARQREEIDILRTLSSAANNDTHVIQMVDEWEHANFGYIMTEFCENGDLNTFLAAQGRVSRLEEWRVWKIMVEVLHGLAVIHSHNILHLDLKPANVFVSFEGHLKIGDFGMATYCPTPPGFEREGDREYIAPEVLERHQYGKPADIFSVGLMMVEVAANIVLPDNGVHWHRLRSGDLSDAGRLSSGDLAMNVGNSGAPNASGSSTLSVSRHPSNGASANNAPTAKRDIPSWAPRFLVDDSCLLDKVVSLMLSPQPERRPTVAQLLTIPELMLVYQRGQAGAIVYEGEFGPKPEMGEEDSVWQRA